MTKPDFYYIIQQNKGTNIMSELPNDEGFDVVYEQLDMECVELEKRIQSIKDLMKSYNKVFNGADRENFTLILNEEDSETLIKQYKIKWLHNNYLLSMLDIHSQNKNSIITREGHFRVMYQILGFAKPSTLASLTLESIDEHSNISKEDFVMGFFESFQQSMTTHDPYFKSKYKNVLEMTNSFFETKADIKNILNNYKLDKPEERVKILLNSVYHLFTNSVIDKSLTLMEEKIIQDIESLNKLESKEKAFFFIPIKDMLTLYISQMTTN